MSTTETKKTKKAKKVSTPKPLPAFMNMYDMHVRSGLTDNSFFRYLLYICGCEEPNTRFYRRLFGSYLLPYGTIEQHSKASLVNGMNWERLFELNGEEAEKIRKRCKKKYNYCGMVPVFIELYGKKYDVKAFIEYIVKVCKINVIDDFVMNEETIKYLSSPAYAFFETISSLQPYKMQMCLKKAYPDLFEKSNKNMTEFYSLLVEKYKGIRPRISDNQVDIEQLEKDITKVDFSDLLGTNAGERFKCLLNKAGKNNTAQIIFNEKRNCYFYNPERPVKGKTMFTIVDLIMEISGYTYIEVMRFLGRTFEIKVNVDFEKLQSEMPKAEVPAPPVYYKNRKAPFIVKTLNGIVRFTDSIRIENSTEFVILNANTDSYNYRKCNISHFSAIKVRKTENGFEIYDTFDRAVNGRREEAQLLRDFCFDF